MQRVSQMVLGTRGSDLARTQTRLVEEALRTAFPELELRTEIIKTRGDETAMPEVAPVDRKTGRKGMFTSEIERALLAGEIDVAVHSAKDLPSDQAAGLDIAGTLARAAVEDVLITTAPGDWRSLSAGATIATGSVRRRFQVQAARPDLQVIDLRGNVPTRLRKLAASNWNAIILARAGLERLGFKTSAGEFQFNGFRYYCAPLPRPEFLNAGGQGIIALQVRAGDAATEFVRAASHSETLLCLEAEREFLRLLDGDCDSPVGVLATIDGGVMAITAQLFKPPAAEPWCGDVEGPANADSVAILASRLLDQING